MATQQTYNPSYFTDELITNITELDPNLVGDTTVVGSEGPNIITGGYENLEIGATTGIGTKVDTAPVTAQVNGKRLALLLPRRLKGSTNVQKAKPKNHCFLQPPNEKKIWCSLKLV
ncbi:hypothetical protein V6Z11_A05G431000 [Gossypium hirsutum]